jgi:hypothetical protein
MSPIAELPVDLLVVIIGYLTLGEASRFLRSMKRGDRLWQTEAVCKCLASSNNVVLGAISSTNNELAIACIFVIC